jgi:nitroreductase
MFIDLVRKRRSVRKYLERPVEKEKVEALVEVALRSPSSRGLNPWEFILVTDRGLLDRLARAKTHGSSFLKDAPLGIVICADPGRSDVWVEDAAIATTLVHLAATSLDLGSCWIQIRGRRHDENKTSARYVAEVLDLPEDREVEAVVAVGYPAEVKPPHRREELQFERVFYDRYGQLG